MLGTELALWVGIRPHLKGREQGPEKNLKPGSHPVRWASGACLILLDPRGLICEGRGEKKIWLRCLLLSLTVSFFLRPVFLLLSWCKQGSELSNVLVCALFRRNSTVFTEGEFYLIKVY